MRWAVCFGGRPGNEPSGLKHDSTRCGLEGWAGGHLLSEFPPAPLGGALYGTYGGVGSRVERSDELFSFSWCEAAPSARRWSRLSPGTWTYGGVEHTCAFPWPLGGGCDGSSGLRWSLCATGVRCVHAISLGWRRQKRGRRAMLALVAPYGRRRRWLVFPAGRYPLKRAFNELFLHPAFYLGQGLGHHRPMAAPSKLWPQRRRCFTPRRGRA